MGKKETDNRKYWCHIRLSESELATLKGRFSATTFRKLSDYVRSALFNRTIVVKTRDRSMDEFMNELIKLRTELNFLGNNFNQVVKRINSSKRPEEVSYWLPIAVELQKDLLEKTGYIQVRINQFSKIWLPS